MRLLAATAAITLFVLFITSVSASSVPMGAQYLQGEIANSTEDPIHVGGSEKPIDIFGLYILPSSTDIIYPSTLTTLRVRIVNKAPETVTILPDSDRSDMFLSFYASSNQFLASKALSGLVFINTTSSMNYNLSSNSYDVDFRVVFDWDTPFTGRPDVLITAYDKMGNRDELLIESAYGIEKRLLLDGEMVLQSTDPDALTKDFEFIRGGAFMVIKGLSLHFFGDPRISPDPRGWVLAVSDDREPAGVWEYRAARSSDFNRISFSFQVPEYCDQMLNLTLGVKSAPVGSDPRGQIKFHITIDSTSPKIFDFRTEIGDSTSLIWKYKERSSGIDRSSLMIKLERAQSSEVIDWFYPEDIRWSEDQVEIKLDLQEGRYAVRLKVADDVDNVNMGYDGLKYCFSTELRPVHDLAISEPRLYPEQLVAGSAVSIGYTLHNEGTSGEYDIPIVLTVDDTIIAIDSVEKLGAGSPIELLFEWVPTLTAQRLVISVDPDMVVPDDDRSNNVLTTQLDVHYRDLSLDPKSMTESDPDPGDMEIVTLHFRVDCIGDLDSGSVKVTLLQDGRFYNEYNMENIRAGTWDLLTFDWKASYKVKTLTLLVDPYNEITESVEENVYSFDNPHYVKPSSEVGPEDMEDVSEPYDDSLGPGSGINPIAYPGQTIWSGPETGEVPSGDPTRTKVIPTIPSKKEKDDLPSFTIPLLGFTITSTMIAAAILALRNEVFRYKLLMFAMPLYSKLKKEKIEQGTRYEILGYIKARPGANYTEIKEILDLNDGSLMHHLRILEREDKVYSKKAGKYKLFYVTSYKRKPTAGDFISPVQRRILEMVYSNPGIVPNKLSKALNRSQTDISYHLAELARNGFLEKKKTGRNIQYYIKDEYLEVLMS